MTDMGRAAPDRSYQGLPLAAGAPFDPGRGVVPNTNGRVTDHPGLCVVLE